ncbi:MAG: hypothetical protein AAFN07_06175 [Pseudomonadota bacterium]
MHWRAFTALLYLLATAVSWADELDYPESYWAWQADGFAKGWEFDLTQLEPGQVRKWSLGGIPFTVYKRRPDEVSKLRALADATDIGRFRDFQYSITIVDHTRSAHGLFNARVFAAGYKRLSGKPLRSIRDDIFVFSDITPYSGCSTRIADSKESDHRFIDGCTGARWDSLGLPSGTEPGSEISDHTRPLFFLPYSIDGDRLLVGGQDALNSLPPFDEVVVSMKVSGDGSAQEQLLKAVTWNMPEMMANALENGASAYELVDDGIPYVRSTLLHTAIAGSGREIVERLLDVGAVVDGRAFEMAQIHRRPEIIQLFCNLGFTPSKTREIRLDPEPPPIECPSDSDTDG